MLLPPHHLCFSKMQNGLSFSYWLTWVVTDKGQQNGCSNRSISFHKFRRYSVLFHCSHNHTSGNGQQIKAEASIDHADKCSQRWISKWDYTVADKPLASVRTRCVHSLIFISPEYRPPTHISTTTQQLVQSVKEFTVEFLQATFLSNTQPVSYTHLTLPTNREV